MLKRRTMLPYLIFLPVFSVVVFFSTKSMYVSALVVEPRVSMEKWSCEGKIDDTEKWDVARQKLEKARELTASNADVISDLGRLHEFKALSIPAWKPEAKEHRSTAIEYYRETTQKRPTWALAWVNLAQSKVLNQESDKEAFDAIRNGFRFGRWQEKVQQRVLWLSIGIWPVLPNDIRKMVYDVVKQLLQQDSRIDTLVLMAFRFDWQGELRSLLTSEKHIAIFEKYQNDSDLRKRVAKQQSYSLVC